MSQEVELKLSLPRGAIAALKRHAVIHSATRAGNAVTLENTYYDTPDLALKAKGVAVRTRRHGRTWLQTVKAAGVSTGGLTRRPEWEQPFNGSFDFTSIDIGRIRKILARYEHELVPVFSTRFRRETWIHEPDDKVRILMMLDTGEVVAGQHTDRISELELELERGQPLDVLLLAHRLVADVPLLPNDVSKAERGYRLHLGQKQTPMQAESVPITATLDPVEAFRELAFSCVRQWQANASGAATSDAPEFIHQLRISQRRLRSLIHLFAPCLPPGFVSDWSVRIRNNANSFGDARDLDVLYEEILSPVAGTTAEEDAALAKLQGAIRELRDRAREQARENIDPAAQGRLLIGFVAALHALPTDNLIGLRTFARLQLKRLRKKVLKRHQAARDLVPARLHALRISLKQLRYGVEFFAPLMPANAAKRYLSSLAKAQNALGFINDVDTARSRLAAQAGDDPVLRDAAAFVCGWHGPRYARLCRRAIRDLDSLLVGRSPWSKGN